MRPPSLLLFLALTACHGGASAPERTPSNEPPPSPEPSPSATAPASPSPDASVAPASAALGVFSEALWTRLSGADGNLAFSPLSAWAALSMTAAGARGATADELGRALGDPDAASHAGALLAALRTSARGLHLANRLFGQASAPPAPPFLALTERLFGAPFEPLDFPGDPEAARAHINGWVERETAGKIQDLLPARSITDDTRLVLTNALLFLGEWGSPFLAAFTAPAPFRSAPGAEVQAPMMRQTGFFGHAAVDGAQVLEMTYAGSSVVMDIVLPTRAEGLPVVQAALGSGALSGWLAALTVQRVSVSLPRFQIDGPSIPLRDPLGELGVHLAFDRGAADFTGIVDPPSPDDRLYVDQVYHKAFVKVDEAGTQAAAATAVLMPLAGAAAPRDPPIEFRADHPFLFVIRDRPTGAILFLGRVVTPERA